MQHSSGLAQNLTTKFITFHMWTKMVNLDLVVQKLDSIIQRMNHYPVNKLYENKLCYPVDKDLFYG